MTLLQTTAVSNVGVGAGSSEGVERAGGTGEEGRGFWRGPWPWIIGSALVVVAAGATVILLWPDDPTYDWELGNPSRRYFALGPDVIGTPAELPIQVLVTSGSTYDQWLSIVVEGLSGGAIIQTIERHPVWPESGTREVEIFFDARCLALTCDDGSQCLCESDSSCSSVSCEPIPEPRLYGGAAIDQDVPCDGNAPLD